MTVTNGYCTEAELRGQFEDDGEKLDQALLERAINATSRAIDRYCGRRFWLDGTASARVYRPADPYTLLVHDIATTDGLIIKTDTTGDGSYATTWASTDYQLEPLDADADGGAYAWWQITAIGNYTFPMRRVAGLAERPLRPTVQVTVPWGWSEIPDDVNQGSLIKAASLFRRKDAPFGVAGFSEFGPVRITRQDPDVINLISPFMRATKPDS
jgi:hypothetical protein